MLNLVQPTAAPEMPVSVVIPIFNEKDILEANLSTLASIFDGLLGEGNWGFILVENGSTDGTPALIDSLLPRWAGSRVIHLDEPNYGAALKAGLLAVKTKWVFLLDIEQWDLAFMHWAWSNRAFYDVLIASKRADPTINRQSPYRRLLSCGLNGLHQLFLGFTGTDTHGPKLLNHTELKSIIEICELDRGQFDTELVLRALRKRMRIVELPVDYQESRPPRNWMFKKIVWNIFALRRLIRVMKDVPFEGLTRVHRFSREDVLDALGKRSHISIVQRRA